MKNTLIIFAIIAAFSIPASAQDDQSVREALRLTEQMLRDSDARNREINKSADRQAADQKVKEIAGSKENEQAIYELAASVFGTLMIENGGDIEKMQQMLSEGLKDPEAFAKKWSPEELEKLETISKQVPQNPQTSAPQPNPSQKSTTYRPPVKK